MAALRLLLFCTLGAIVLAKKKKDAIKEDAGLEARSIHGAPLVYRVQQLEAKVKGLDQHAKVLRGRDGRDGIQGKPGKDGKDGRDGSKGLLGPPGPKGDQGKNGAQGPPGQDGGGVQYTRWGRTDCQGDAELIYKGRMAGTHYTQQGGGVNYLCMTEKPEWLKTKDGFQASARLYGTEYELSEYGNGNDLFGENLHDRDATCAVCYVKTRSAKLIIPGTYKCPAGWKREYYGYLMTEHYNHPHPRDYVCVDNKAQPVPGTEKNLNGALLYPVESHCGSLPCPPYDNGKETTCAVCTK